MYLCMYVSKMVVGDNLVEWNDPKETQNNLVFFEMQMSASHHQTDKKTNGIT